LQATTQKKPSSESKPLNRQVSQAASDLGEMITQLGQLRERLARNPNDQKAAEDLEEIVSHSKLPLEVLSTASPP